MQKVLVTYLASFILLQGVFVHTNILFEINEVLEDYQLHTTKYGDSTYTFLSKHFGDLKESHKKQHQEDHKQHKHPVQDQMANSIRADYTLQQYRYKFKSVIEIANNLANFHYIDLFSTFEKPTIFQPPRFA